ncbi:uncharacterized protein LOC141906103 [Tubulanus polymorphus]|uniref:uncharacterized protein LOC141906103 n=1 Tax=Tubulanus polymorphus TaxID=672921 RepID=UPI003DA2ADF2
MPYLLGLDHKTIAMTSLAVSTGIAMYSTYKYLRLRRQNSQENVYESQKSLNEYLVFHYGTPKDLMKWDFGPQDCDFPKRCADICIEYFNQQPVAPNRALDIGCAVGRSTFELTPHFQEVVGIDYSHSFVDMCNHLKESSHIDYSIQTVGDLSKSLTAKVPDNLEKEKAIFLQGDACNLPLDLGSFGCVLAANLICRLHSPRYFLQRLASLVAPGGILVITSPYTFMAQYTPKRNWLGGYVDDGDDEINGFEGLKLHLGAAFELIAQKDVPFVIRETERKHQWTVAHVTVWKRNKS